MNPLTAIFNLFKKGANQPPEVNRQWIDRDDAFQKGKRFYLKGQLQEALECFDSAIDRGFEDGEIYGLRGLCLQSFDFHLDAIDDFNKAIMSRPDDSGLYYMRSISSGATGDLNGCASDLQEAIRLTGVDNADNRSHNVWANEKGYKGVIDMYKFALDRANLDLEMQSSLERRRRDHPDLAINFGPDLVTERRAKSRRRIQHERSVHKEEA